MTNTNNTNKKIVISSKSLWLFSMVFGILLGLFVIPTLDQKPTIANASEVNTSPIQNNKEPFKNQEDVSLRADDPTELPDPNTDPNYQAQRIEEFLTLHNSPIAGQNYGAVFVKYGQKYNRHPYAAVAIAFADTSLGKTASNFNIGNTGMTDEACRIKCPDIGLKSWEQGIEDIFVVLTNQYLKNATKLCHLSRGGWSYCPEGATINQGKFYASSQKNWQVNTSHAFSWLMNQPLRQDWEILP